jgi:hypothetical protein
MKYRLYACFLCLLFAHIASASDNINRQEAVTRLEQAVSKTNIFELPSFLMRADIQIEENGKLVDGTYELLWNGPDQWREGIRVPGYTEVQIGDKGTVRVKRSTDFIPVPIYNLHQALGFGSTTGAPQSMSLVQPALGPKDTIKKENVRKDHGEKLTCFEIDHGNNLSSDVCVNDASGTLVRSSQFSDDGFQPVGTKTFPRGITFRLENRAVARITVTKLASPAQFTPDAFTPPAGVTPQAGCMNPLAPHAVDKPAPHYPESAGKAPWPSKFRLEKMAFQNCSAYCRARARILMIPPSKPSAVGAMILRNAADSRSSWRPFFKSITHYDVISNELRACEVTLRNAAHSPIRRLGSVLSRARLRLFLEP